MLVMKFGGGTLATGKNISQMADLVSTHPEKEIAVVVSAFSGVTDKLHEIIEKAEHDESAIQPFVKKLTSFHLKIARDAILEKATLAKSEEELHNKIRRLERMIYGVSYTEQATERTRDFILSFGERLAAIVAGRAVECRGRNTRIVDADEIGIMTDGVFGRATADLASTEKNLKERLLPQLKKGKVAIITGYFGCDREGRTTVFGRGASDYSAGIIGYALDADLIEVWKDVSGFMTADPKQVEGARLIHRMTYDEVAELGYFGARVLHPRIVEPAGLKGIPIRVRNLFQTEDEGTLVQKEHDASEWLIRSVAVRDGLATITLSGPAMAYTKGLASRIFTLLSEGGVNVYTMAASMASFSLVVENEDASRAQQLLATLRDGTVHELSTQEDLSLVCIVGEGLRETKGIAARTFQAVAEAGVNIEMISDSGSDIAFTFMTKNEDAGAAMVALHHEFIEKKG